MRRNARTLVCAFVIAVAAFPAAASANSASPESTLMHLASYKPDAVRFSAADNTLVRVYFARNPVVWTGLPPEMARSFARGKELPYGIRADALPLPLLTRLPAHPGFGYARVGSDVALVDNATRVVVDMIENVFD